MNTLILEGLILSRNYIVKNKNELKQDTLYLYFLWIEIKNNYDQNLLERLDEFPVVSILSKLLIEETIGYLNFIFF